MASLNANLEFGDVVGETVTVAITLPWSMISTVPVGAPALAAERTVTLNVTGWPSVPAFTSSFVAVCPGLTATSATFFWK